MSLAAILGSLVSLAGVLMEFFRTRQARKDGRTEVVAETQRKTIDVLQGAQDARQDARDDLARNPGGLRDDDGFRRAD